MYQIHLSKSFITEFQYIINWEQVSQYGKLSEDFMRKYQNKLDWRAISQYQELSESFIIEFKHMLSWKEIIQVQKLSESFLANFDNIFLRNYREKIKLNSYLKFFFFIKKLIRRKDEVFCHVTNFE